MKNSTAALFFRASECYSKFLNNKKYIFGTVNSGNPLFFTASTSCSKIQNVKCNSRATLFFRESAGYSKLLNNKKYKFRTINSGNLLFFKASASCSKIQDVKSIFHTAKNLWATLFFQGKRRLLKTPE